ncbi:MAG: phytoene desaturase family protein [Thermomicrobiales bacterium]
MKIAVVGSGPNGLAAAITLAEAGLDVDVLEQAATAGGGCRSDRPIFDGCLHDHCATVLPLAIASPFFQHLNLDVEWLEGPAALAHPLDDALAVLLHHSLDLMEDELGDDGNTYRTLFAPLVEHQAEIFAAILQPIRVPALSPRFARFAVPALLPLERLNRAMFRDQRAPALLAGIAAHSTLPFSAVASSAPALVLGMLGHSTGWPIVAGGAQTLSDRLCERLRVFGGRVELEHRVRSLDELRDYDRVVFDTSVESMVAIASDALPDRFKRRLRHFRSGPGVFKLDWVLDGPIPWSDPRCGEAVTVHLGGNFAEIARAEREIWQGRVSDRPFVILTQPSIVDASRAPAGRQVVWAYCHVPSGSELDMTSAIEGQIERFAPGFRDRILGKHATTPAMFEAQNPNLIGGDISGGMQSIGQILARPYLARDPYRTPNSRLFLASSSTPPGGGVHGMCGYNAAKSLLRDLGSESAIG